MYLKRSGRWNEWPTTRMTPSALFSRTRLSKSGDPTSVLRSAGFLDLGGDRLDLDFGAYRLSVRCRL